MNAKKKTVTYKIILKDQDLKVTIEGTYRETFHKLIKILLGKKVI